MSPISRILCTAMLLALSAGAQAEEANLNQTGERLGRIAGAVGESLSTAFDRTAEAVGRASEQLSEGGRELLDRSERALESFSQGFEEGLKAEQRPPEPQLQRL